MVSIMKQSDDHDDKEKKGRRVSELQKYKNQQMDCFKVHKTVELDM